MTGWKEGRTRKKGRGDKAGEGGDERRGREGEKARMTGWKEGQGRKGEETRLTHATRNIYKQHENVCS